MQQSLDSTINKSIQLIKNSQIDEAESLLKQQLLKNPSQIQALNILGQIYLNKNDYSAAVSCLEKSVKINPKDYLTNYHLGLAYQKLDVKEKALQSFFQSSNLKKNFPDVYKSIGTTLAKDHEYYQAYEYYKKIYRDFKDDREVLVNLFYICKRLGMHKEALDYCRKAYRKEPNNMHLLMSLIFNAHKDDDLTLTDFKILAEEYYNKFLKREHLHKDFSKQLNPNKTQLKIGFVSPDLFQHPVSSFLLAIIERLNKTDFETFLYYSQDKYDDTTKKFQELCPNFKSIFTLDDKAAAELISNDDIDILFDLSGYTKDNRLGIFAQKPAPIQVTYMGYFGTLGMPEMDYILADENVIKADEEKFFTEKIQRLGKCFTHANLSKVNQVSKIPPYKQNGYITFGCTNRFHKVSEQNIHTWAEILKQVPDSKFLLNCASFSRESNRNYVQNLFAKYGIEAERLILLCDLPREDFLQCYAQIDILLDPFPYGGGTTSLESLLNGVPVITISGDRWVSRMTETKLRAINCPELIASNTDEYIKIAVNLAHNTNLLDDYRQNLNAKIHNSDLNIEKFMQRFSKAMKDIWQKECKKS